MDFDNIIKDMFENFNKSDNSLTCCKCNKFLSTPPIMLCTNGSNICGSCYKEEDYSEYTRPIRNKIFESLLPYCYIPCKFKEQGCHELRLIKFAEFHALMCPYRPFKCPVSSCNWNETAKSLKQHYQADHSERYMSSDDTITIETNHDYEKNIFVCDQNMQFIFQTKFEKSNCKFWFGHVCITSPLSSNSYFVELQFFNPNAIKSSIVFKHQSFQQLETIDKNSAFEIDCTLLKSLLKNPETLHANISFSVSNKSQNLIETKLLKELECPACWHYLTYQIYMCSNGHSFCHACKNKMSQCPTCREDLSKIIRNRTLENLISEICYPCKNNLNGCRYIAASSEIISHENTCSFNDSKSN